MAQSATFTAHNIALDDGTQTKPDAGYVMSQHRWFLSASRLLRQLYPQGLQGVRIADLGCLEGGYSIEFARLGMEVVGIEVRDVNFRNCEFARERLSLPNLRFVQDDVWNVERHGPFDVIFCCGLLYHLDRPREFLTMLGRCAKKAIILNTHFAPEETNRQFELSSIKENEGLRGRWFAEHDGTAAMRDKSLWASWNNKQSFWLCRPDLLHAVQQAGFEIVLEQFDTLGNDIRAEMANGDYGKLHRSTIVGLR